MTSITLVSLARPTFDLTVAQTNFDAASRELMDVNNEKNEV